MILLHELLISLLSRPTPLFLLRFPIYRRDSKVLRLISGTKIKIALFCWLDLIWEIAFTMLLLFLNFWILPALLVPFSRVNFNSIKHYFFILKVIFFRKHSLFLSKNDRILHAIGHSCRLERFLGVLIGRGNIGGIWFTNYSSYFWLSRIVC